MLAVALAAIGCAPDCSRAPGEVRPNVVLVTIDTLRADHLGAYGSTTVATPNLDRLAGDGLVFERAYSASDVTIPSHLSLLSSLPVVEHGVVDLASPVARPAQLLPELFQTAGYRTAAFVSAVHLGPTRALGQLVAPGVSRFEVPRRESKPYRAAETNDRLFPWLRGNCRTPFFVWVHYWDPHMPYTPESPWDTAYYQDDPYALRHTSMSGVQLVWFAYDLDHFRRHLARDAGHVRALKRDLGASSRQVKDLVLYPNLLDRYTSDAATRAALRARIREIATRIRPGVPFRRLHADWLTGVRDVRFPLARYAGEVSSTDAEIGRLRDELTRLGDRRPDDRRPDGRPRRVARRARHLVRAPRAPRPGRARAAPRVGPGPGVAGPARGGRQQPRRGADDPRPRGAPRPAEHAGPGSPARRAAVAVRRQRGRAPRPGRARAGTVEARADRAQPQLHATPTSGRGAPSSSSTSRPTRRRSTTSPRRSRVASPSSAPRSTPGSTCIARRRPRHRPPGSGTRSTTCARSATSSERPRAGYST